MTKIWVCFSCEADMYVIGEKLKELGKKEDCQFIHCFLSRKAVVEKGMSRQIVDMLDRYLKDRQVRLTEMYGSYDEIIFHMNEIRQRAAELADVLYVVGEPKGHVKDEIQIFTQNKVVML